MSPRYSRTGRPHGRHRGHVEPGRGTEHRAVTSGRGSRPDSRWSITGRSSTPPRRCATARSGRWCSAGLLKAGSRPAGPRPGAAYGHLLPRYFRGVHDDVQSLPRKDRLERRTRAMARIGGLILRPADGCGQEGGNRPRSTCSVDLRRRRRGHHAGYGCWALAHRCVSAARRGDDADAGRAAGAVSGDVQRDGQPAAVVPWGLDEDGVPTSIQLVGRPFDEATLLSLGAQIEKARPWAQRRPPVS